MEITDKKLLAVLVVVVLFGTWYMGYWSLPAREDLPFDIKPEDEIDRGAAILKLGLKNAVTQNSVTSGNNRIDITAGVGGVFDFTTRSEPSITVDNASEDSTSPYSQGTVLVFHCMSDNDPTGATDYYDRWYYAPMEDGADIRRFTERIVSGHEASDGTWTYSITGIGTPTGQKVIWVAGDTPYWSIGALAVVPRVSAANLDLFLMYGGSTLSYIDDGSTWDETAGTPSYALEDSDEEFKLKLDAGASDVAYGCDMITVTQSGELQTRSTFAVISTTMLAIDSSALAEDGWRAINDNTLTTEDAWYYKVSPMIPGYGDSFLKDITIPVDSSGASTTTSYTFKVWLIDFQLEALLAEGTSTTSIPSARGFINQYGLDVMIFARPYATTGGAGTTQVLTATIYTPAS